MMQRIEIRLGLLTITIVAAMIALSQRAVYADITQNLPMVFDPKTKKYFIGGESKFVLKKGGGSTLIDRIEISLDGGEYKPYNGAIRFDSEGKHTIKFRAVSPVNNWAPVQYIEVFVDLTPPLTQPVFSKLQYFEGDNTKFVAINSKVRLESQDNLSGVSSIEYSWDDKNYEAYQEPFAIERKGKQILHIRSRDRVGNQEPTRRITFIADGTPPRSALHFNGKVRPITLKGKSYLAASDSVTFQIKAEDPTQEIPTMAAEDEPAKTRGVSSDIKNIWISINGKPFAPYIKPIYFLQEGSHKLKYYSEDNVGNKEKAKTVSIYTVSAPPRTQAQLEGTVVNTGGINFATPDFRIRLSAKDNAVGLERIEVKVDREKKFRAYLEPVQFLTAGMHRIAFRSVDRVGNVEPTQTYTVIIQTTPPETTIQTAQPIVSRNGVNYSPSPNVVSFNVKDSGVGIEKTLYKINEGPFKPYKGPFTVNSKKRVQKITFKSIDKLGNSEKEQAVVYHMIGSSPEIDLFVSDGQNAEEKVRTKYFDSPRPSRDITAQP